MVKVVRLRKGLNIRLKGTATKEKTRIPPSEEYALVPEDFVGVIPKVVVREGENVKAGDTLFVNKASEQVRFASPVSGIVSAIVRGERRKVLRVVVKADAETLYKDFGKKDVTSLSGDNVRQALMEAGLFGYINQLPYAISTSSDTLPEAIFVSALRDMPLSSDFEMELEGNEEAFQTGLTALSKIATTYLGIGPKQKSTALTSAKNVQTYVFDGPCPAGNVGVQVNHISPASKDKLVWTVDPSAVIFMGRLFLTGKVDLRKVVAIAGTEMAHPMYVETLVGTPLKDILKEQLRESSHVRLINGNPLTGRKASLDDYLGAHTSEVTAIPEGDDVDEMLGWILPRTNQFSVSRSYFSWLFGKKEYKLDARVKGGERHMIMSGEYDKVLPMDIYGEFLVKAIIAGDIDRQEALGIYEVSPEDFALAEFVDSSKLELQKIVRQGLDILRKENG